MASISVERPLCSIVGNKSMVGYHSPPSWWITEGWPKRTWSCPLLIIFSRLLSWPDTKVSPCLLGSAHWAPIQPWICTYVSGVGIDLLPSWTCSGIIDIWLAKVLWLTFLVPCMPYWPLVVSMWNRMNMLHWFMWKSYFEWETSVPPDSETKSGAVLNFPCRNDNVFKFHTTLSIFPTSPHGLKFRAGKGCSWNRQDQIHSFNAWSVLLVRRKGDDHSRIPVGRVCTWLEGEGFQVGWFLGNLVLGSWIKELWEWCILSICFRGQWKGKIKLTLQGR